MVIDFLIKLENETNKQKKKSILEFHKTELAVMLSFLTLILVFESSPNPSLSKMEMYVTSRHING